MKTVHQKLNIKNMGLSGCCMSEGRFEEYSRKSVTGHLFGLFGHLFIFLFGHLFGLQMAVPQVLLPHA